MSNSLRNLGLAALFAATVGAMMPGQASALSMSECSVKYKAAKAADPNTPAWNDFRKANCGATAEAAPAAPAAAPAKAPAAAPAKATAPAATPAKKATTTAAAPAPAPTPSGSFMANCSANWKAMKTAGTTPAGMDWKAYLAAKCPAPVAAAPAAPAAPAAKMSMAQCSAAWKAAKDAKQVPDGMTWNQFRSAGCTVTGAAPAAGAAADATTLAPPEPADTPDNTPLAAADKNGKPYTAGQLAAHKRIKQCGVMWQQAKATNKLPANILALDTKHRWPQYWSLCNKQLKAKGM